MILVERGLFRIVWLRGVLVGRNVRGLLSCRHRCCCSSSLCVVIMVAKVALCNEESLGLEDIFYSVSRAALFFFFHDGEIESKNEYV